MRRLLQPETSFAIAALALGTLLLGLVFWRFGIDPMWAIMSFVLVYDSDARAVRKAGFQRLVLTICGSAIAMALVFALGVHRWLLPVGVAIAAIVCGLFVSSRAGWRVLLVTVALIVGSSLLQPSSAPYIAVIRSIEVCAGSLLAILLSHATAKLIDR